jgi:hypothetical protein
VKFTPGYLNRKILAPEWSTRCPLNVLRYYSKSLARLTTSPLMRSMYGRRVSPVTNGSSFKGIRQWVAYESGGVDGVMTQVDLVGIELEGIDLWEICCRCSSILSHFSRHLIQD